MRGNLCGREPVKPGRCAARLQNICCSNGGRLNSLRSNSSRPDPILTGCFGALSQCVLNLYGLPSIRCHCEHHASGTWQSPGARKARNRPRKGTRLLRHCAPRNDIRGICKRSCSRMSLRASEASVAISISPGHAKCCSVIKKSMQSRGGRFAWTYREKRQ